MKKPIETKKCKTCPIVAVGSEIDEKFYRCKNHQGRNYLCGSCKKCYNSRRARTKKPKIITDISGISPTLAGIVRMKAIIKLENLARMAV